MRVIVIGAVAAGTSAAAKARRNDEHAEIVIYEKDRHISYSGCGLPYFIGGKVADISELTPRDPAFFKKKYDIDIFTEHEVLEVDTSSNQILVRNLETGNTFTDCYDKLVIATGASPSRPPVDGLQQDHVFFLRNVRDALRMKDFIMKHSPKRAVIAGTGFIGFELLENLELADIEVSIVELADKITPNLDRDMANFLENTLLQKGVRIYKSVGITEVKKDSIALSDGKELAADMVIMATGVRPNVALAENAGIALGVTGAIKVNATMQTSTEDVYACGDCIETYSSITGKAVYRPLGSTANKTGRIAGDQLSGGQLMYRGNLGTGIFKLFDLTVASTGLTEKEALIEGYDIQICHNIKPNKPEYMGGKEMLIKAVADKKTGRLLGAQIIGEDGVDKRIDVFATLITYKATVDELFYLDLAYAPPFSTTKDPVHYTGMILDNAINGGRELITPDALTELTEDVQIVDARSTEDFEAKGHIDHSVNIPHAKLREQLDQLDKQKVTVTYCNKGVTGNAAQNILLGNGFKKVYNLSGGQKFYKASKSKG